MMVVAASWIQQFIGSPIAVFAFLAFVAATLAAIATALYARTTHRIWLDAASPRLAISVGNVGWPPLKRQEIPKVEPPWLPISPSDPVPIGGFVKFIACKTVVRLRNDGSTTAFVRWTVRGSTMEPTWGPPDSLVFSSRSMYSWPPGHQIDVDFYPGYAPDEWVQPVATIVWDVEVQSGLQPGVVDRTTITWKIEGPTVARDSGAIWAADPHRSCEVAPWKRDYT